MTVIPASANCEVLEVVRSDTGWLDNPGISTTAENRQKSDIVSRSLSLSLYIYIQMAWVLIVLVNIIIIIILLPLFISLL